MGRWVLASLIGLSLFALGYLAHELRQQNPDWPATRLHAAAAVQNEAYAMATGPIDEDVEGLFILNALTGDLQCSVMSIRTGRFAGLFRTNVLNDLGLDPAKRPSYLMTTGQIAFPRGPGAARPAFSIVYVLDTTSGNFAAYGLPWRRDMANTGRPQAGPLTLQDVGQGPTAVIRE
jgi:hypothetical protein